MIQSKLLDIIPGKKSPKIKELIKKTGAIDMAFNETIMDCPDKLIDLSVKYLKSNCNTYSSSCGVLKLREEISKMISKNFGHEFDPENEITITAGHVQAIHTTISTFVRNDDEVIIIEPTNESIVPSVLLNDGKVVYFQLKAPLFKIEWEELRMIITAKTSMIIINIPHDSTGFVLSEKDMLQLQKLTNGTNIVILSLETYGSVFYDNITPISVAKYENLIKRSIIISDFGPSFNINGWMIGYCLGPENLMSQFRAIQQIHIKEVNIPLQYALADYLPVCKPTDDLFQDYQGKRDYFNRLMENSKYKIHIAEGGYFEMIDYSEVSDMEDIDFVKQMANDYGVVVFPASAFYHEKTKLKYVRICFVKDNDKLEKAANAFLKMQEVCKISETNDKR